MMNEREKEIERWGLDLNKIEGLGDRLMEFCNWYGFKAQARDTSEYGYHYLSGILRLEKERTSTNISRAAGVPIQNTHHDISKSPWSSERASVSGHRGSSPSCQWQRLNRRRKCRWAARRSVNRDGCQYNGWQGKKVSYTFYKRSIMRFFIVTTEKSLSAN